MSPLDYLAYWIASQKAIWQGKIYVPPKGRMDAAWQRCTPRQQAKIQVIMRLISEMDLPNAGP